MKRLSLPVFLLAAPALAVAALLIKAATAGPTADFAVSPPGPAVGQNVDFLDASTGSPTSWSWDFGDGTGSAEQNPFHTYAAPGPYVVTLTVSDVNGSNQRTENLVVSTTDTLRLLAIHPFSVTLAARDQRTGTTGGGFALPQTDVFGFFSIPAITSDAENPEVFLKVLDGTAVNGEYWVFYGGLTDLEYTLTVTEVSTGRQKSYSKAAGSTRGGFDTSAFSGAGSGTTPADLLVSTARKWLAVPWSGKRERTAGFVGSVVDVVPPNPVTGQVIRFHDLDVTPGTRAPYTLLWTFGDGATSTQDSPIHVYDAPGAFNVQLSDQLLHQDFTRVLTVTAEDILSLDPSADLSDEYHLRLTARDQRTNRFATGNAIAYSQNAGGFSIPVFTGDPNNPEIAVKVLDGRPVNNQIWSFRGSLSDLQIGFNITQTRTGLAKYYFKESGSALGGFDIGGFDTTLQPTIDAFSPNSGPVGAPIHVTGDNFFGVAPTRAFFLDPRTAFPLPYEGYPLRLLDSGHDVSTNKDFIDFVPFPPRTPITSALSLPFAIYKDGYFAQSPNPYTLQPGFGSLFPVLESVSPTHGAVGTPVTVTGSNLGYPGTKLKFRKDIRATILTATDTTIGTQVPQGAVTGPLEVWTPYGTTCSTFDFTVEAALPLSPTPPTAPPTPITPTPTPTTSVPTPTPTTAAGAPTITMLFSASAHVGDHVEGQGSNLAGATFKINGVTQTFNFGDNQTFDITIVTGTVTGRVCATNAFGTGCSEALLIID